MASGKIDIKGTITIKDGKKKKKKQRKPRKKKDAKDTTGFTGSGIASTRQEFGQPYTAAAVMNAAMLRPMLQFQQPTLGQTQFEQKTLEPKESYYQIEDIPYVPRQATIKMTKGEFMERAAPFLERSIEQGIQERKSIIEQDFEQLRDQYENQTRQLQDIALRERDIFEEEQRKTQEQMNKIRLQGQEKLNAYQEELTRNQNFFENELEQQQGNFQKQLADLALQAKNELESQRLEDLSNSLSVLSMDKALYELVNEKTKEQLDKQTQKSEGLKQDSIRNEIAYINALKPVELIKQIKEIKPLFNEKNPDGSDRPVGDLRYLLMDAKGLSQYAELIPSQGRGRKAEKYRMAQEEFFDVE